MLPRVRFVSLIANTGHFSMQALHFVHLAASMLILKGLIWPKKLMKAPNGQRNEQKVRLLITSGKIIRKNAVTDMNKANWICRMNISDEKNLVVAFKGQTQTQKIGTAVVNEIIIMKMAKAIEKSRSLSGNLNFKSGFLKTRENPSSNPP